MNQKNIGNLIYLCLTGLLNDLTSINWDLSCHRVFFAPVICMRPWCCCSIFEPNIVLFIQNIKAKYIVDGKINDALWDKEFVKFCIHAAVFML